MVRFLVGGLALRPHPLGAFGPDGAFLGRKSGPRLLPFAIQRRKPAVRADQRFQRALTLLVQAGERFIRGIDGCRLYTAGSAGEARRRCSPLIGSLRRLLPKSCSLKSTPAPRYSSCPMRFSTRSFRARRRKVWRLYSSCSLSLPLNCSIERVAAR